jgi:hypothetical protein
MSECRGPDCSHPSHDDERRRRELAIAALERSFDRRLIPNIAREVLIREPDGRLTPTRTFPAPATRR